MVPNQMTGVFGSERRGRFKTEMHRREGHVKMEVETEVMLPQTEKCKGCQLPPKAWREAWNRFSLKASKRNQFL